MKLALIITIVLLFVGAVAALGVMLGLILSTIENADTPDDQDTEDGAGPRAPGDSGQ